MVYRKRKKRKIGSRTHGHGSSKRARGAGNRGGRGRAGLGKKAQHKKFKLLKEQAKKKKLSKKKGRGINLSEIEQKIDFFVKEGSAEKKKDCYIFYADKAGYDKVLGSGSLKENIEIHAKRFSDKAKMKLKKEGLKPIEQGG